MRVSTSRCAGENTVNVSTATNGVNERYYSLSGSGNSLNLNIHDVTIPYLQSDQRNRGAINITDDASTGGNSYVINGNNAYIIGGINAQLKEGDKFALNLSSFTDENAVRSSVGTNKYDNERGLSEPDAEDISMIIRNAGSSDISLNLNKADIVSGAGYGYSIIDTGNHSNVLFNIQGQSSLSRMDVYTGSESAISVFNESTANRFNFVSGDNSTITIKNARNGEIMQLWLREIAQQLGGNHYSDTRGMLGVKYAF